jgi:hypothetical protein
MGIPDARDMQGRSKEWYGGLKHGSTTADGSTGEMDKGLHATLR